MKIFAALFLLSFPVFAAAENEIHLRANQLGYRPGDPKIAIAVSNDNLPKNFSVVAPGENKIVFHGTTKMLPGETWGQFSHHAELDFSSLKKPGKYFLDIGGAKSFPFVIRGKVYADLPDQLLEFMRQQRCGYNPWLDAICHSFDGRTAYGPMTNGTFLDCSGGWHDAGDLLKYLLTSGNATAQMLLAYQLGHPLLGGEGRGEGERFADRFNALGQLGANGIPDILDEAKWGLDWMLKLHPQRDQLWHQVADDRDHQGWRLPQNETVDYGWGAGKERVVYFADGQPQGLKDYQSESTGVANLAGRYAAAMALAYQIWKKEEERGRSRPRVHKDIKSLGGSRNDSHADENVRAPFFAEQCLRAAIEVYELGRAKEGVQQGNSYGAPYRYAETTWADDMEWGAAELFRATGDQCYIDDARRYAQLANTDTWMGKEQTGHYQFYPFVNLGHFRLYDLVDKNFQKILAGYYREGIEQCLRRAQKNPYRAGVPFIWCSNNLMAALATQCLLYERMTGDTRYREFASEQSDWLLGRNPWGTSMFTDIGEVFPRDVHLMANKILHRTIRGGLVDGPVYERIFKSLKGVSITEPDPFALFQDERAVYHDDIKDYSTNEPTMDGTASAILLWALLN